LFEVSTLKKQLLAPKVGGFCVYPHKKLGNFHSIISGQSSYAECARLTEGSDNIHFSFFFTNAQFTC